MPVTSDSELYLRLGVTDGLQTMARTRNITELCSKPTQTRVGVRLRAIQENS
jgi:hypothetical protein